MLKAVSGPLSSCLMHMLQTRSQLSQREEELERETRRRREDVRKLKDELKRREAEILRNKYVDLECRCRTPGNT